MKNTIIHFETLPSTNAYLKEHYEECSSFTFVQADYQSEGRGRNDRKWESNNKDNLLFSLLIKDEQILKDFRLLSMGSAYVVAKYLETLGLKDVSIKWPNDVYVNGKKICGILLEGSIPTYLVIGIGLNVNQKEYPNDLRRPATSISLEKGKDFDIQTLLETLSNELTAFISSFKENMKSCEEFIASHNFLAGKLVKTNEKTGVVVGISPDFGLLLDVNGQIETISSGEIDFIFTK